MATVRMSDKLLYKLKDRYKEDIVGKLHPQVEISPSLGDALYNSTIGRAIEPLKQSAASYLTPMGVEPDSLFRKENYLPVTTDHVLYSTSRKKDEHDNFCDPVEWEVEAEPGHYLINVELSSERSLLGKPGRYSTDIIPLVLDRADYPELDEILTITENNSKQKARNDVSVKRFMQFLGSFTTLNQALKAYPPLDKLIESDTRAKIHKKYERKRQEEDLKNKALDMDQTTGLTEDILTASLLEE